MLLAFQVRIHKKWPSRFKLRTDPRIEVTMSLLLDHPQPPHPSHFSSPPLYSFFLHIGTDCTSSTLVQLVLKTLAGSFCKAIDFTLKRRITNVIDSLQTASVHSEGVLGSSLSMRRLLNKVSSLGMSGNAVQCTH